MKLFGVPIKTVKNEDLIETMAGAPTGTVFVIGEAVQKNHEGDDTVELVLAQIIRTND